MKMKMTIYRIFVIGVFVGISFHYLDKYIETWWLDTIIGIAIFLLIGHIIQHRYKIMKKIHMGNWYDTN